MKIIQQQLALATKDIVFSINRLSLVILEEYLPNVYEIWMRATGIC